MAKKQLDCKKKGCNELLRICESMKYRYNIMVLCSIIRSYLKLKCDSQNHVFIDLLVYFR